VLEGAKDCLTFTVNGVSFQMVRVEGGMFVMGAMEGDEQAYDNEKPAHEVNLTYNYYIGKTEVTQALWQAVMGNNPSTIKGDDLPVNNVLWEDADLFAKRLSELTGCSFHLPTEAEWEYAARGGKKSKNYRYAGSDNVNEVAWYSSNSSGITHPVGTKQPNELGIYDMSGNVWEWCSDWLAPYSSEALVNPIGPATGAYHVYHGGGWDYGADYCRISHRRNTLEGYVKTALGLRIALREKVEPEAVVGMVYFINLSAKPIYSLHKIS
jgi:formylglycine-generating enzyme required for sulfatase activity